MYPPAGMLHPFDGLDLAWLLEQQASLRRDHPFVIFEPWQGDAVQWSYAEFHERARRLAHGLQRRGVRAGDRVLVHLDNCAEFLMCWCACGLIGAVAVTTNTRSAEDELRYFIEHSGAVAAITQPRLADLVARCGPQLQWIALTAHDSGEAPAHGHAPGADEGLDALMQSDAPAGRLAALSPATPLAIQYTSGTTARPKAVVWTHANALWGARINATHEGLRAEDIHDCVLPLYHTNALAYAALATLWAGATVVLQPRFSSSRFWEVANKYHCTWSSITLFCVRALLQIERPASHSFRQWGVAHADPRIPRAFGIPTISWWGMTETLTHGIVGNPHLPHLDGAIGRAAPEYGIRIVDPEGRPVPRGGTGMLQVHGVRGLSLFSEYLHDVAATAAAFDDDGWFLTGDQVTLLEDGCIRFADRQKDMLKVGGENVASSEIERVIAAVGGVDEVAVVARPHAMLDEVPVAFIKLLPEHDAHVEARVCEAVLAHCREALAPFKVPREVHVVQDFPRANVEKIAKARLREQWAARWAAERESER